MKLVPLLGLLISTCRVQAKGVFAHFMVANAANYTDQTWQDDIQLAQEAHIDAFALNLASNVNGSDYLLQSAFTNAGKLNFKMFISFDMSSDPWPSNSIAATIDKYGNQTGYYKVNDTKPLVSTFEGGQNADVWNDVRHTAQTPFFFIPEWSSLGLPAAVSSPVIDGLMSWTAWPTGTGNITDSLDEEYMAALNGRPYIMPVSPWFYTNLPFFNKNFFYKGDDLWYDRWQQVLQLSPEFVEIITWNDYGESHYIGPVRENELGLFYEPGNPFDYVTGMPHDGWRQLLPYVIDLFKSEGKNDTVQKEGLVSWYRLNPSWACNNGKTSLGDGSAGSDTSVTPATVMEDSVFYSALLASPADVTVSIGGKNQTRTWTNQPDGETGLYHGSVPFNNITGEVVITLSRDGESITQIQGQSITTNCTANNGYNNWNAWVGSAMSDKNVTLSTGGSSSSQKKSSSNPSLQKPTMILMLVSMVVLALS